MASAPTASDVELKQTHTRQRSRGFSRQWIETAPTRPYRDDEDEDTTGGDEKAGLLVPADTRDGLSSPMLKHSLSLAAPDSHHRSRGGSRRGGAASMRGKAGRVFSLLCFVGAILATGYALGSNSVARPRLRNPLAWIARYYGKSAVVGDAGLGTLNDSTPAWRPIRSSTPGVHWDDNILPDTRYLTHIVWGGYSNQIFEVRARRRCRC